MYPNATIVLITSWHYDGSKELNGETVYRLDYTAEGMKAVYETNYKYDDHVKLIDAGDPALTDIHMYDPAWREIYSNKPTDFCHLNAKGMEIMANSMEKILPDALFVCDGKDGVSVQHSYENGICKDCQSVDPLSVKEEGITRVVCVGDSITANGYWKNNMMGNLDSTYEVIGLGVSGSTGLAAGTDQGIPKAYVNQDNHQLALRRNADAVVIMLGTNDSKPENCNSIQADNGAQYIKDMTAMVNAYKADCPDAQIFLAMPATVYDGSRFGGISEDNVTKIIIPCLEAVAEATGAILVDTHTATANAAEHFTDGVHPSDDVARGMLAKAIADAILENNN
jgi:lysophospholipase L1-like esterase